jgi:hypothetical protein
MVASDADCYAAALTRARTVLGGRVYAALIV